MADYSFDLKCGCSYYHGHNIDCEQHPLHKSVTLARANGYHPVFKTTDLGTYLRIDHYECRRGCGCLVWDTDAHSKTVCTKFEPVIG